VNTETSRCQACNRPVLLDSQGDGVAIIDPHSAQIEARLRAVSPEINHRIDVLHRAPHPLCAACTLGWLQWWLDIKIGED
jgi:RNA polymerase subunit RPABC4/transcription elongation factor Spt4